MESVEKYSTLFLFLKNPIYTKDLSQRYARARPFVYNYGYFVKF